MRKSVLAVAAAASVFALAAGGAAFVDVSTGSKADDVIVISQAELDIKAVLCDAAIEVSYTTDYEDKNEITAVTVKNVSLDADGCDGMEVDAELSVNGGQATEYSGTFVDDTASLTGDAYNLNNGLDNVVVTITPVLD